MDLSEIATRLSSLKPEYTRLKDEDKYLRSLLKQAMIQQQVDSADQWYLEHESQLPLEVSLVTLAELMTQHGIDGNAPFKNQDIRFNEATSGWVSRWVLDRLWLSLRLVSLFAGESRRKKRFAPYLFRRTLRQLVLAVSQYSKPF